VDNTKSVAIIGAGFAGLAAAASLRRAGIGYEQFEFNDDVGGNWYNGMYDAVYAITSRKTTEFPDYPMPSSYPDFPSRSQVLAYLHSYCRHWDLRASIRFGTKVERCEPTTDQRWRLTLSTGEQITYEAVVVANGHYWDYVMPKYPGNFSGTMLHSKQYKTAEQICGRRVLVVGGGNSATDIAIEAAQHAACSDISMRRGYWFVPKAAFGAPLVELSRPWTPLWFKRLVVRAVVAVVMGDYRKYGLPAPDHRLFDRAPTVTSAFLEYVRHGRIRPRTEIKRLDGKFVEFADGSRDEYDVICCGTGYAVRFPMLDERVVRFAEGYPDLVSGIFAARHKNLYVVGLGYPRYGIGPLVHSAGELVAHCIQAQRRIRHPIGSLLTRFGLQPMRNYYYDPHEFMRKTRWIARLVSVLAKAEAFFPAPRSWPTHVPPRKVDAKQTQT
jgi:hypothetical protein